MLDVDDIKRWLDDSERYNLDNQDRLILLNHARVQELVDITPLATPLNAEWVAYQGKLLAWIQANTKVSGCPDFILPCNQDQFCWLHTQKGADTFVNAAQVLLTWHGERATHEQLRVAEFILNAQSSLYSAFDGFCMFPSNVWSSLLTIAKSIAPSVTQHLETRLHAIVATCQHVDQGKGVLL